MRRKARSRLTPVEPGTLSAYPIRDPPIAVNPALLSRSLGGRRHNVTKTEQVGIAGWLVWNVVPELEEQRALEQKVRRVPGYRQAIQQSFQAIVREREIEVLLRGVGTIFQAGADRGRAVLAHDAAIVSRYGRITLATRLTAA